MLNWLHCFAKVSAPPEFLPACPRPSGLTIRWKKPADPTVTQFGLSWRAPSWWTSETRVVDLAANREEQETHITGLQPGEKVQVWIYSITETGSSAYSQPSEFVRPDDIFSAVYEGNIARCEQLVAGRNAQEVKELVCQRDPDGNTLAHWGAVKGFKPMLTWLNARGCDLFIPVAPDDMLPLHWACVQPRDPDDRPDEEFILDTVRYLLELAPDKLNAVTRKKRSCIVLALQSNMIEVVAFLMEHGIDLTLKDLMGNTLVHWAAYYDDADVIEVAIEMGADLLDKDITGQTALHIAAQRGSTRSCEYLIAQGGQELIDALDVEQRKAIDVARNNQHDEICAMIAAYRPKPEPTKHVNILVGGTTLAESHGPNTDLANQV